MIKRAILALLFFVPVLFPGSTAIAQTSTLPGHAFEQRRLSGIVSYVSSSLIYVNIGREDSLAVGDTLTVTRRTVQVARAAVTALSRHSSAAQILLQEKPPSVGDEASITKTFEVVQEPLAVQPPRAAANLQFEDVPGRITAPAAKPNTVKSKREDTFSGRAAIQYAGVKTPDSRLNFSQPSATLRLEAGRLFGSSLRFSMYGRSYYDLSRQYNRYGDTTRLKIRMYEFLLEHGDAISPYGYSIGRMSSRYFGGLGSFDGGQLFLRQRAWTAGMMLGAQANNRTSAIESDDRRGGVFVNYRSGKDIFRQYDGTLAYGREMFERTLDREFVYFQNSVSLGPRLNLYQSSEIDLNDITRGVRTRAFHMTNTFITVNHTPYRWLAMNIGYDASRSVYLFGSMRAFPDTLLDKHLLQGYRASATVRLPRNIVASASGNYRARQGSGRDSRTLGVMVRASDIAASGINAGLRYSNIAGIYTVGNDFTLDVDRPVHGVMSLSLRFDRYTYSPVARPQRYHTATATAGMNYRMTRSLYSTFSADRVWETTMNSVRVYCDFGVRF